MKFKADPFGERRPSVTTPHRGQHRYCVECNVIAADTYVDGSWPRGGCQCSDPIVKRVGLFNTYECGRCGREIQS